MLNWLIHFFRRLGEGAGPATDPIEGATLRLRCDNSLTMRLQGTVSATSITLRLPLTNSITFRLQASN